jgi:ankyrin repeat protein
MDYIQSRHSMGHVKQALVKLPTAENEFYDKSIQRIKDKSGDADWAMDILAWIYFAQRPLRIRELQHVLAVRLGALLAADLEEYEPKGQSFVDDCEGLVVVNRQSETITLAHPTIRDYLDSASPRIFKDPEVEITRTCLTYLSYDVFSEGPCTCDITLSMRLDNYPLLQYAAHHWGDHARGEPELKLQEPILTFFRQKSNLLSSVQVGYITGHPRSGESERFPRGARGLWVAASFGLANIVNVLLQQNEDIEAKYDRDQTVLHRAAQRGHEAVVQVLLDHGADIAAKDSTGCTAFHQAAESGHKAVMSLLLARGADVDEETNRQETALWCAARSGNESVVRFLQENGANINAKEESGSSVLWIAAMFGQEAVVRLLLKWGADVHAKDQYGQSALAIAAYHEHKVIIRLLLETGPEWTALHEAVWHGQEKLAESLLEKGAHVDAKDQRGWTALHWACRNGHETVARRLLQRGADVSIKNKDGLTALDMAARNGHIAVVQTLLDKEPHIDVKGECGRTPLQSAARHGHELVMRLLLERGADINARDNTGVTALHYLVRSGQIAATQLLLERGADVHMEDESGCTALFEAILQDNEPAAQLLLENGADPMNAQVVRLVDSIGGFDVVRQWQSKSKRNGQSLGLPYRDNRPG